MAVNRRRNRIPPPLDEQVLEQIALRYVGRYATTRAKLAAYLERKVRERGWSGTASPGVSLVVQRLADLGYVDDRAFAAARAESLGRRGYGPRRVREALRAAGIAEEDSAGASDQARSHELEAALRLARRRSIGPFASSSPDRQGRERAMATLLRAGHSPEVARRVVDARPGEIPTEDAC